MKPGFKQIVACSVGMAAAVALGLCVILGIFGWPLEQKIYSNCLKGPSPLGCTPIQ